MNNRFCFCKKMGLIASMLMFQCVINAQVMWSLRGGIMPVTVHENIDYDEDATVKKIDWMVEFGIEIPTGKNWNIETALRYKSKNFIAYEDYNFARLNWKEDYLAKHPELDHDSRIYRTYSGASLLELPIRITYKLQLNDNFAFHFGVGPYASINLTGKPFDSAQPFKSSALTIGIEPAVALYYKNVSIGATYNNPVFFQRHKEMDSNRFMITLGFRFKNKVWKAIGKGLEKAADSGALDIISNTANKLAETMGEYNRAKQELMENSNSTPSSSSSSSSKPSSSTNGNKYNMGEQQSYNTDKSTYGRYDSMLSAHFYGGRPATGNEVKQWQQEMKSLREKWIANGKSLQQSANETHSTASCPSNKSHSH